MINNKDLTAKVRTFLTNVAGADKETANQTISLKTREAVTRYLLIIWANQTDDEQTDQTTKHRNGMGFSGLTGSNHFVVELCKRAEAGQTLSGKQAVVIAKKIVRYSGQIAAGASAPVAPIEPMTAITTTILVRKVCENGIETTDSTGLDDARAYAEQMFAKKAHKKEMRDSIPTARRRALNIGSDGLTNSERAFDSMLQALA